MLTACTQEVDFPDEALDEILAQLDIENALLKHSAGILHCGYAFVESGFVPLLCERLPFEIVGFTTIACATGEDFGSDMLSLSVLTSDDVLFSVAHSASFDLRDIAGPLGAAYRRAEAALPARPALVLAQFPLDLSIGVSQMLNAIIAVADGVPVFGSLPCDATPDYHNSVVICNGEVFPHAAALLLLCGNVRPRFFVENVCHSEDMQEQYGIITESDDCVLKRINDMPFLDYIEEIGISREVLQEVKAFPVPFKVNYNEGTKSLIRVLYSVTSEGHAVFASEMPAGGSIAMQRFNYDSVMETVENMLDLLRSLRDVSGVFLYSCVGRNFQLGGKAEDEMLRIRARLNGKMPYHLCYAGGEVCPLKDETGVFVNHSHSYSLVACVL
ncbi:MAG: FIST C-terminal domain-containing protein [Clostridiales Family XIII bacterium]|jgi:hypothetical protein|nr:FIST C-terminal domain-containing protein [Clostridiales Family XIII bacterium]